MNPLVPLIERILIPCPASLKGSWPDRDFEMLHGGVLSMYGPTFNAATDTLYLRLPLDRSSYTPNYNYTSSGGGITRTLGGPRYNVKAYVYSVDFKVLDERKHIFDITKQIVQGTLNLATFQKSPIQVLDFVLPEPGEYPSTRTVILTTPKPNGGAVYLNGEGRIKGGFDLKLEEVNQRYE